MKNPFYKKSFLKLTDFSQEEVKILLDLSKEFKRLKREGVLHKYLEGKNIVLLFEKTSTRTRSSFEVAGMDLGMGVTFLDKDSSQMGKKESIADTAKVLGRIYDGIEYRGFDQSIVEDLARESGVPVYNGLTDQEHPTQMLADLMTIEEHFGSLEGKKLVFMGDGRNNVSNSLLEACALMGIDYSLVGPKELFPEEKLVEEAEGLAKKSGSKILLTEDIEEGTRGADVIYTDIWLSMGEDAGSWEERINLLKKYQVNEEAFKNAGDGAIFMHCLPSYHDLNTENAKMIYEKYGLKEMEVTDQVFLSDRSLIFEEAENRMHTIKAILFATLSSDLKNF